MSKPKKAGDSKDNNISSKLLGANLSDVNIEKFRDISVYKKQKYELGGKFSMPLLKSLTNKFSPLVIFTICLPNQAINSIEALSECENLMVLCLSHNSIQNISILKKLTKLRIVDFADNSITNVDALATHPELVNLHLEGNLLKTVDNLTNLKSCFNLRNLHLQTLASNQQNPICSLNSYRNNIFQTLPQLKRLDSIPQGVDFYNATEIKDNKKKDLKVQIKNIGPFYTNKFPTVSPYLPPVYAEEANLKKSITGCKSAMQELQLKMRAILTA